MEWQRQAANRILDGHRLRGRVDCLQEGKVLVHRFGDLVDVIFWQIRMRCQEVWLSNGLNVSILTRIGACWDRVRRPKRTTTICLLYTSDAADE